MASSIDLDRSQKAAVVSSAPVTLVVGGAGTGKTEVLAARAAKLLADGSSPASIQVLVSYAAAASDLRDRIRSRAGDAADHVSIGSLRSVGAGILREYADLHGRRPSYVIHDREDAEQLVAELLREAELHEVPVAPMVNHIWLAKANLVRPSRVTQLVVEDGRFPARRTFEAYEQSLETCNAFDLPDLIVRSAELLQGRARVRKAVTAGIEHLLVDDLQNLTPAERRLCDLLASAGSLFVCGDDDQGVLDVVGGDPTGVLEFCDDHAGAKRLELERCHRSSANLVEAGNEVIARNDGRIKKIRTATRPAGSTIRVLESWDERAEATSVERSIRDLQQTGAELSDIAIVCRAPAQFKAIEGTLRKLIIPHRVIGTSPFYETKEVKDLLAYLKVIVNPSDLLSLGRIINVPRRGIGKLTLARVQAHAEENGLDLFGALRDADNIGDLPKNSKTKILKFCGLIDDLIAKAREISAAGALDRIIDETAYIEDIYNQNVSDREAREGVVRDLQATAKDFSASTDAPWVDHFLEEVCLRVEADRYDPAEPGISLMTIPVVRGLEFPHVIIAGLEEGILPASEADDAAVSADRRLFYVAMSRAADSLTLCHARNRSRSGTGFSGDPSRFLDEIPDSLREHVQTYERETEIFDRPQNQELPPPGAGEWVRYEIGDRVVHAQWGSGKVLETEGLGQDLRLTIRFEEKGLKKLLLRYAKLEKIP